MANLLSKTKDELIKLAKKMNVSTRGTKADIVDRIENESDGVTPGQPSGELLGATVTPIKKTLKDREDAKAKDRKALEKRMAKRGSTPGSAH